MGVRAQVRRGRTGLLTVAAAVGLVVAVALPGGAADIPTLDLDPASGPVGTEIAISGTCATASQDVAVDLLQNGEVIASTTLTVPGGTTAFDGKIQVPASAQPGDIIVRADCLDNQGPPLEVVYTVTAPPPPPAPPAPEPEPEPAAAAAPAPVAAQPTFTG